MKYQWMKIMVLAIAIIPVSSALAGTYTVGIDRPGAVFFDGEAPSATMCASWCQKNSACAAWSFGGGNGQGCVLKSLIPAATAESGITSGTSSFPFEPGVDRPLHDITSIPFPSSQDPMLCVKACKNHPGCKAFAINYDAENMSMVCWIKDAVPAAQPAPATTVSGIIENF